VELLFEVNNSSLFSEEEKVLLNEKLQSRFNKDGYVQVICDEERSQYLNKEARLGNKKLQSAKKADRKKNFDIS
jgi:ribosome-associated protein